MRPIEFIQDLWGAWKSHRRQRELIRQYKAEMARPAPLKCRIVNIGMMIPLGKGKYTMTGWVFEFHPQVPLLGLSPEDEPTYCGYSIPELREIHARRSEWN